MCAAASLDLTNPPEMKQQENFLAVNFFYEYSYGKARYVAAYPKRCSLKRFQNRSSSMKGASGVGWGADLEYRAPQKVIIQPPKVIIHPQYDRLR